LVLRVLLDLD
jgi:hypothetical protein